MTNGTKTNSFGGEPKQIAIPPDIYHYTKLNTALKRILPSRKFRLGLLGNTNDPRETKPWDMVTYIENNSDDRIANEVIRVNVPKVMRTECKVACFTSDFWTEVQNDGDRFANIYYGPGYARPRMWAQYAENHKGVCLLFDGYEFDKSLKLTAKTNKWDCEIFQEQVSYDLMSVINSSPFPDNITWGIRDSVSMLGKENTARKFIRTHWHPFFFRKHPDWKTETEYRWLIHSPDNIEKFVPIARAIKKIIVTDF